MSTPVDLAHTPSSLLAVDQELDLAALLDLFSAEDDGPVTDGPVTDAPLPSPRRSLRGSGARLRDWAQDSSRRAAGWGAVPAHEVSEVRVAPEAGQ